MEAQCKGGVRADSLLSLIVAAGERCGLLVVGFKNMMRSWVMKWGAQQALFVVASRLRTCAGRNTRKRETVLQKDRNSQRDTFDLNSIWINTQRAIEDTIVMPSTFLYLSCYYWIAIPVKRCRGAVYPGHSKFSSNYTHTYMHLHTHIHRPYNVHAIQLLVTFEDMRLTQQQYLIQYNLYNL